MSDLVALICSRAGVFAAILGTPWVARLAGWATRRTPTGSAIGPPRNPINR